jgi:hypothetical protein
MIKRRIITNIIFIKIIIIEFTISNLLLSLAECSKRRIVLVKEVGRLLLDEGVGEGGGRRGRGWEGGLGPSIEVKGLAGLGSGTKLSTIGTAASYLTFPATTLTGITIISSTVSKWGAAFAKKRFNPLTCPLSPCSNVLRNINPIQTANASSCWVNFGSPGWDCLALSRDKDGCISSRDRRQIDYR